MNKAAAVRQRSSKATSAQRRRSPATEDDRRARAWRSRCATTGGSSRCSRKEWVVRAGRSLGELERNYCAHLRRVRSDDRGGHVPVPGRVADSSAAPRVGDGVLMLDADAARSPTCRRTRTRRCTASGSRPTRSACVSPSSASTTDPSARRSSGCEPVVEEFEQGADVTLLCRCVPLLTAAPATEPEVVGGLLLVRDVTELRKRDRLLLSKDATIREIHHRVKNNLQTISSLLRLQARRLTERRGEGGGRGVGPPDPHDRARPRVAVARAGRRHRVHRDRAAAAAPRRGGPAVAGSPGAVLRVGRRRPHPARTPRRRCRSC